MIPTATANANPSAMTAQLCSNQRIPCSIRVKGVLREATKVIVDVTGTPGSRIQLQAFRLKLVGSSITGLEPIVDPIPVNVGNGGYGSAVLGIPPMQLNNQGGWVLVAPSDTVWENPAEIIGDIVSMGMRRPTILGDGYGTEKPVNVPIELDIANYIWGSSFAVEYLGDDDVWHNLTLSSREQKEDSGRKMTLIYEIPQGLHSRPYTFRLLNITDPKFLSQEWQVTPVTNAISQPKMSMLKKPELGTDLSGIEIKKFASRWVLQLSYLFVSIVLIGLITWFTSRSTAKHRLKRASA